MSALPDSDDRVRELRRCLEVIRDRERYDPSSSIATMQTLEKIFNNIERAPDEPKFRRLRTANAKIAGLMKMNGVQQFMLKSGWQPTVHQMEEVWLYEGGEEVLPLLRAARRMLTLLSEKDAVALEAANAQRLAQIAKDSQVREMTLAEIKADHEVRAVRFSKKKADAAQGDEQATGT